MVVSGSDIGKLRVQDFRLLGTDGAYHTKDSCMGINGLLVMFICCHCPYVQAIIDNLDDDCRELQQKYGLGVVGIMPNDYTKYPEDSYDNMVKMSREKKLCFPFVLDDTQNVAKAYGAVCTPEFFGFNKDGDLCYHGRFDDSMREHRQSKREDRDLYKAMVFVAQNGCRPSLKELPSMGCSIKWKEGSL